MNNQCILCKKDYGLSYYYETQYFYCNPCLVKILELNNKCVLSIDTTNCENHFERYQWLSAMTKKGYFGFIYFVYNKIRLEPTVLKVQEYIHKNSENEIEVACNVSELPNFVKLYNYWICDIESVDDIWKSSYGRNKLFNDDKKLLCYMEMEKCQGTLDDIISNKTHLTKQDKLSIVFESMYFLNNAYKQLGFNHNDIHTGNIFYNYNNNEREYTIYYNKNDKKTKKIDIICKSLFFPTWGDFGKSEIKSSRQESLYDMIIKVMIPLGIKEEMEYNVNMNIYAANNQEDFLKIIGKEINYVDKKSTKKRRLKSNIIQ